jgi:FMN reductase (NADPH)
MHNPTIETIHAHRSIRKYKDEQIPHDHIELAVIAGQAAATSSAVQSYSVLHITDSAKRQAIADLCGPQQKVHDCGAFFVICADNRRHMLMHQREKKTFDQRLEAFLLGVIDGTLFAQNMVLALESMGYGTCYIGGLRNDLAAINTILNLPQGVMPIFGLCAGVPDESPSMRPRLPLSSVLHTDSYPDDELLLASIDVYDDIYAQYLNQRGAKPGTWSKAMLGKYENIIRPALASFYESQGANLH